MGENLGKHNARSITLPNDQNEHLKRHVKRVFLIDNYILDVWNKYSYGNCSNGDMSVWGYYPGVGVRGWLCPGLNVRTPVLYRPRLNSLHLVSGISFLLHPVNLIPPLTLISFSLCFRHFYFLCYISHYSYSTVALVPPMSTMDVWRGIT